MRKTLAFLFCFGLLAPTPSFAVKKWCRFVLLKRWKNSDPNQSAGPMDLAALQYPVLYSLRIRAGSKSSALQKALAKGGFLRKEGWLQHADIETGFQQSSVVGADSPEETHDLESLLNEFRSEVVRLEQLPPSDGEP